MLLHVLHNLPGALLQLAPKGILAERPVIEPDDVDPIPEGLPDLPSHSSALEETGVRSGQEHPRREHHPCDGLVRDRCGKLPRLIDGVPEAQQLLVVLLVLPLLPAVPAVGAVAILLLLLLLLPPFSSFASPAGG